MVVGYLVGKSYLDLLRVGHSDVWLKLAWITYVSKIYHYQGYCEQLGCKCPFFHFLVEMLAKTIVLQYFNDNKDTFGVWSSIFKHLQPRILHDLFSYWAMHCSLCRTTCLLVG